MNFSVGVFDLFAATVPGSLYVAIFLYVGQRTDWPGVDRLAEADTTVLIVCGVLVAYLLGTVFGAVAQALSRLPTMTPSPQEALREFRGRNPDLAGRRFLTIDHYTLLAGLRQHAPEGAVQVDRFRANGYMLRNTSLALLVASGVALVEVVAGPEPTMAACAAGVMMAGAAAALAQSRRLRHWAITSTLEAAAWLPDVAVAGPERP